MKSKKRRGKEQKHFLKKMKKTVLKRQDYKVA